MGTRNLTMVISKGETKIAQYGQWDGYPSGQGATGLKFLNNYNLNKFKQAVDELSFYTEEELTEINKEENPLKKYPYLSRDTGAEILQAVYDGKAKKLINRETFAADSLFCEYAYVVDLDKNTFEIYEGFNQEQLAETERFFSFSYQRKILFLRHLDHPIVLTLLGG